MSWKIALSIIAGALSLGGFFGYLLAKDEPLHLVERYPYLSKRVLSDTQNEVLINFIPLRQALKDYVGAYGGTIGVYFEYLPSGISIGVNEKEEVKLASLSKVPLVMSIYKKIELGEMTRKDTITLKNEHLDKKFGNLWMAKEGASFEVSELVKLSLIDSDNTAYHALLDALTADEVRDVYDNLDVGIGNQEDYPAVSPKSYSSIFRSLYLSSYLTKESSNEILGIMTQSHFDDKIKAGVPDDVRVAHKIGVFTRPDTSQNVFIDCDIVYVPNRPYILCMFVQDSNEAANEHMEHLSKMIYGYVAKVEGGRHRAN